MMAERKADEEKGEAERKVDREVATRLEAVHDKTDAIQLRVKHETELQEKMDAWIADMKNDRKETTAFQDTVEANLEKIEPNSGEQEAMVERQEIPNEDVAVHSLKAYRNEITAYQETTEARLECKEPTSADMKACHEATDSDTEKI
jgi:hypothetical protein